MNYEQIELSNKVQTLNENGIYLKEDRIDFSILTDSILSKDSLTQ